MFWKVDGLVGGVQKAVARRSFQEVSLAANQKSGLGLGWKARRTVGWDADVSSGRDVENLLQAVSLYILFSKL